MSHLIVTQAPHIHSKLTTRKIMLDVLIALTPAAVASILIFGLQALLVVVVSVACCFAFELLCGVIFGRRAASLDLSTCVTGLILALTLPATIPLWQVAVGAFVAIVGAKHAFGGIGKNPLNPAATARLLLSLVFSGSFFVRISSDATILDHFLGTSGSALGACAPALLLGAVYLLVRRVITWETPVIFTAIIALAALILGRNPANAVLLGAALPVACFMLTDTTTSPLTAWGRVVYAAVGGVLAAVCGHIFNADSGVYLAVLVTNLTTPFIDMITFPTALGSSKK